MCHNKTCFVVLQMLYKYCQYTHIQSKFEETIGNIFEISKFPSKTASFRHFSFSLNFDSQVNCLSVSLLNLPLGCHQILCCFHRSQLHFLLAFEGWPNVGWGLQAGGRKGAMGRGRVEVRAVRGDEVLAGGEGP